MMSACRADVMNLNFFGRIIKLGIGNMYESLWI